MVLNIKVMYQAIHVIVLNIILTTFLCFFLIRDNKRDISDKLVNLNMNL